MVDGTFDSVPHEFKQMITFMGISKKWNRFVNLFHILIDGKSEEKYTQSFNLCSKYLCRMQNLSYIISDFEKGLMNSLKNLYGDIQIKNCYFHYVQILRRQKDVHYPQLKKKVPIDKMSKEQIIERLIFKCTKHFPFVNNEYQNRFKNICSKYRRNDNYVKFFIVNYSDTISNIIEQDDIVRTQNALEGWHRILNSHFGSKPTVERFVQTVYNLDTDMINMNDSVSTRFVTKAKDKGDHILSFINFLNELESSLT